MDKLLSSSTKDNADEELTSKENENVETNNDATIQLWLNKALSFITKLSNNESIPKSIYN